MMTTTLYAWCDTKSTTGHCHYEAMRIRFQNCPTSYGTTRYRARRRVPLRPNAR